VSDIDLATPTRPEETVAALTRAGIKSVPTGLAHGTVTAVVHGRGFEITTLRRDVETDGRHAVVAFSGDWKLDAARRDFTINAMTMARDGTVFDYFGGREDLAAGRLRFVGDPATRIAEDYLRILRFFRFYARFARIPPDLATLDALTAGIPGLSRLSVERVWSELRRILPAPDPTEAIRLMDRLGIWPAIVPEASALKPLGDLPPDPILRLTAMLTGDALALANRLKLSNLDRDRLLRLIATPTPGGSDDDLRRLLADHLPADLTDRAWIAGLDSERQRLAAMPRPVFPLKGGDAVALGASGQAVGDALRAVRQWWLDRGCHPNRAECLEELARQIISTKIPAER
jgi:poly(A) polymerase/tRNA nucleotidyltransferase (CCA-adding enzyme)